jgi:glycosyltransferase involved in cell wall biosynthesis
MQYVSVDSFAMALLFKAFRRKVILYFVGTDLLYLNSKHLRPLIIRTLMLSDFVLCTNSHMRNILEKIVNKKTVVFVSPVYLDDFPQDRRARSHDKIFDLINIGNLDNNKNQEVLIKACSGLGHLKLLIIGDGPMSNHLKNKAREFNVDLTLTGPLPHDLIWRRLLESKIYVHVSKREGLPVAILEAMYCDLPIVVTPAPYTDEFVDRGFKMIIAENGDPSSLVSAISSAMKNLDTDEFQVTCNRQNLENLYQQQTRFLTKLVKET